MSEVETGGTFMYFMALTVATIYFTTYQNYIKHNKNSQFKFWVNTLNLTFFLPLLLHAISRSDGIFTIFSRMRVKTDFFFQAIFLSFLAVVLFIKGIKIKTTKQLEERISEFGEKMGGTHVALVFVFLCMLLGFGLTFFFYSNIMERSIYLD